MSKTSIRVYTDGSATTANKPGGWAFRVVANGAPIFESSGYMEKASNNDAELEAAIQGLRHMKEKYLTAQREPSQDEIKLVSDSQLILGWASGNYKAKQPEKIPRIEELRELVKFLGIKTEWVKGHSGDVHNSRCDKLAKRARAGLTQEAKQSFNTNIGPKRVGTLCLIYKGDRLIIDLDSKSIELYDSNLHGLREFNLQVTTNEQ
jgi:ribonuclease HI